MATHRLVPTSNRSPGSATALSRPSDAVFISAGRRARQAGAMMGLPLGTTMNTSTRAFALGLADPFVV
jgi:hypothetical protein